jgi:NAD dependent epimerase/dehydratase family enzyme
MNIDGNTKRFIIHRARIKPTKLLKTGYEFRFPNLEFALKHSLGKIT